MPKTTTLVINTSPLISLVAALGDLNVLDSLYQQVLVGKFAKKSKKEVPVALQWQNLSKRPLKKINPVGVERE